jgi:ubiquinone/menaquinone biosynthesis C-methylase UbiE
MKNESDDEVPRYLSDTYWWAYVHPKAVAFFERQWLVNLILFGNYKKLKNALIQELNIFNGSRSLQLACAYGDFSSSVLEAIGDESRLDIVDVAQIQLDNLHNKLNSAHENIFIDKQDSTCLKFDNNSFDNVLLFFLLHEQPKEIRRETVREALRVCKPGGRLIYIDYHKPVKTNPLRYLMYIVFKFLEPYALDFWEESIESLHALNDSGKQASSLLSKKTYYGQMYQRVVIKKN